MPSLFISLYATFYEKKKKKKTDCIKYRYFNFEQSFYTLREINSFEMQAISIVWKMKLPFIVFIIIGTITRIIRAFYFESFDNHSDIKRIHTIPSFTSRHFSIIDGIYGHRETSATKGGRDRSLPATLENSGSFQYFIDPRGGERP